MSHYRGLPLSLLSTAILVSVIIVGGSLVRGGGDEPKPNPSITKTAEFPWIESPRVGEESRTADPVALLVRRVEALENRVATLERARQSPIAPSSIGQPATPENWRSFEFNGRTIYVVPTSVQLPDALLEPIVLPSNSQFRIPDQTLPATDSWPSGSRLDQTLLKYEPLPPSRK
ncbi:MAG TPA: hypothetical protein VGY55_11405 [Pirellulales bacterium]|jgi:hypothetical protein|nr:hypothetical protein [Pirellulales bacterium]